MDEPSNSIEAKRKEFGRILLEAVDRGLGVLGDVARQIIYSHIETNFHVKREEVPVRLEAFHEALEGFLGAGARALEKLIIKNLCERLGLRYEDRKWSFTEYIRFAHEVYPKAILGRDDILDFVKNVKATDHFLVLYDRLEDKHLVAFTYLKVGLERSEAGMYVAGVETAQQIRQAMKEFGIDVDVHEGDGSLRIVDYDQWYIIDGKVDASDITTRWQRILDESKTKGWKGLRAAGEADCFLKHNLVTKLVEYEKTLGMSLQIPMVGMCVLNSDFTKAVEMEDFLALVKAHGSMILARPEEPTLTAQGGNSCESNGKG